MLAVRAFPYTNLSQFRYFRLDANLQLQNNRFQQYFLEIQWMVVEVILRFRRGLLLACHTQRKYLILYLISILEVFNLNGSINWSSSKHFSGDAINLILDYYTALLLKRTILLHIVSHLTVIITS